MGERAAAAHPGICSRGSARYAGGMKQRPAPDPCPCCDEAVPRNAKACPHCGADWKTGWNEDGDTEGRLGLPDDDFDYEDFARREFGEGGRPKAQPENKAWVIWTAFGLLVVLLFGWLIFR